MRPELPFHHPRHGNAVIFCIAAGLFVGCRQNDEPGSADELFTRVREGDYHAWMRAPGYEQRRKSNAPHHDQVEIFVDEHVAAALTAPAGAKRWPVGSIIVKDGFSSSGVHDLVAIMEKRESGWFYAEYDGQGEVKYSGAPNLCVDCHASGSDQVRAFHLP